MRCYAWSGRDPRAASDDSARHSTTRNDTERPRTARSGMSTVETTRVLRDGTRIPAIGFGTYPLDGRATASRRCSARSRWLPAARHGGELRQRGRGGRGDPRAPACPARRSGHQQDPRPPPRVRRRARQHPRVPRAARPGLPRPAAHPLAQPQRRQVRRGVAGAGRGARAGPGAVDRRLELHRRPPRSDHRRHRRDAGGEPDRAAPATSPRRRCAGPRAARHPHRVLEPAGQAPGAVHRARRGAAPPSATASPRRR